MIALDRRTMTYEHEGYLVDIVTEKDNYEAWIYLKDYGDKHMMFGMPKSQQSYFEFFEIVRDSVLEYTDLIEEEMIRRGDK